MPRVPRRSPRLAGDVSFRARARVRAKRWIGLCAAILIAGSSPAQERAVLAQAVNQAVVSYTRDAGKDPGKGPTIIASNTVVTRVLAAIEFDPLRLSVDPPGTVAPGTQLTYTLLASNRSGADFTSVTFRLPLATLIEDPLSATGNVSGPGGPYAPVTSSYDAASRTAIWFAPSIPDGTDAVLRVVVRVREDAVADSVAVAQGSAREDGFDVTALSNPVETPIVPPLLQVTKTADRATAAPGDAVGFSLVVRHTAAATSLAETTLVDRLPDALRYVPGSLRVDGEPRPDPQRSENGSEIRVPLGPLNPGESRAVSFAARLTVTSESVDVVNRGWAEGLTDGGAAVRSPDASAAIHVSPGPFRQEGHLVGRVFLDEDGDGRSGASEPGVPGVLVRMEDGRGAVTDITGRWSLQGVRPGLHVLRLEPATLHESLVPLDAGADWAGNRRTRFVESRAATMAIADFPVRGERAFRCELKASGRILRVATGFALEPDDPRTAVWLDRAAAYFAALGVDGTDAIEATCNDASTRAGGERDARLASTLSERMAERSRSSADRPVPAEERPAATDATALEEIVRSLPPIAAILAPPDGSRAERESVQVDVTYPLGYRPDLRVNGSPIDAATIGSTSTLPSRGISASRYIGVRLEPGRNQLEFRAVPPGSPPGAVSAVSAYVTLPGPPVGFRIEAVESRWVADGSTPGQFRIEAVDAAGVRVAESLLVTVDVEGAAFAAPDLDPDEDGVQVRLEAGTAALSAGPWISPGNVHVRAWRGDIDAEWDVTVVPASGSWRVTGLVEGRIAGNGGIEGDGGFTPGVVDEITGDGGRVAVLASGPVGTASRLTVSVDTARERDRDRLFGPFEPDAFYPVPGDSSVEIFGAERQGPLYARVDGPWGFALYGDFSTGFDRTELARYDRRLPGFAARARRGPFSFEGFAASSDQTVVRDLFEPDGTSGPYLLSRAPVVSRSESVILETRDRFRSDEVIGRRVLRADLDYALDPEAGTILFRGPVAPYDPDLQPVRLVVVYETRSGAQDTAVGGVRLGVRRGDRLEAGMSAIREGREGDDYALYGLDVSWRPRPGTHVHGEIAASDDGGDRATASTLVASSRLGGGWSVEASYRDLPPEFSNPTLLAAPEIGSRRATAGVVWQPPGPWRAKGEITWQHDERNDVERGLASAEAERRFQRATLLGALRRVETSSGLAGEDSATVVEAGARGQISKRWTGEVLHRQALGEPASGYPDRTVAGLGFEIAPGQRLFLKQEWESGDGPNRDRTVAGVETSLTRNTKALAQYSLEGGIGGDAARASAGIETTIPLRVGSAFTLRASRVQTTRGETGNDFTTLGGGWERRSGDLLVSSRYELYLGSAETRHLATGSGVFRLAEPWTLFVRERVFVSDAKAGPSATRLEGLFGAAYRPLGSPWQFLARLEHSTGGGTVAAPGGVAPGSVTSEPFGSIAVVPRDPVPPGVGFSVPRSLSAAVRDEISLHLATGVRIDARQRLAATWIGRKVGAERTLGVGGSFSDLLSLHYTVAVHPRWTLGASARRFAQRETGTRSFGSGLEVGYLAWKDLWLLSGYNVAGFRDDEFPTRDRTAEGAFLTVRFKFDEMSLTELRDLRLDRP